MEDQLVSNSLALVDKLTSSPGSGVCADCLASFGVALHTASHDARIQFRRAHPDIFIALNGALTSVCEFKDIEAWKLRVQSGTVLCPQPHIAMYKGKRAYQDTFGRFVHSAYSILSVPFLATRKEIRTAALPAHKVFKRDQWPAEPRDLYQHGVPQTMYAHLLWATVPTWELPAIALQVIACILLCTRSVAMPALLASPSRETLVELLVLQLHDIALDDPDWPTPDAIRGSFPTYAPPPEVHRETLNHLSLFFRVLQTGFDYQLHEFISLIRGYEKLLLRAISEAITTIGQDDEDDEQWEPFVSAAAVIERNLYGPRLRQAQDPEHEDGCSCRFLSSRIRARIHAHFTASMCSLRTCPLRVSGIPAPYLKKCNKCQVVRYCGRECQRADWTAHHKKVCGALERINDSIRVTRSTEDEFFAVLHAGTQEDYDVLVDWSELKCPCCDGAISYER